MTRIFAILMITLATFNSQANISSNDPISEVGIEFYPSTISGELSIEVDEKLANEVVTVSVFNSVGEIVLEKNLQLGMNTIDTSKLSKGNYVAVVRQNDKYKSKSSFEVV